MIKIIIFLISSLTLLQAMSLEKSIKLALQNNNKLQESYLDIEQAQLQKKSVNADNFGKIDLKASYNHYNNARTLVPLSPMEIVGSPTGAYGMPTTKDMFTTGISYNVVLFDGFAQESSYKISDLVHASSIIRTKLDKEELIYNTRALYITLLSLQKQLVVAKEYTFSQRILHDNINEKFELGSKSKLDLLKAKNSYIVSKSNEDKIEVNIEILKENISVLMGGIKFDVADDIVVDMDVIEDNEVSIFTLDKIKLITAKSDIASKNLEKTKSLYYPTISLNSYFGYNYGPNDTENRYPSTGEVFISKGEMNYKSDWNVGIGLKWNIFDFGSKSNIFEKNQIAIESIKLQKNERILELNQNIKNAKSKLKLAQADYNSANSGYELLDEIVSDELLKYESGKTTLDDLLLSKAKKNIAYLNVINSKYEYQKVKYYIEYLYEKGGE